MNDGYYIVYLCIWYVWALWQRRFCWLGDPIILWHVASCRIITSVWSYIPIHNGDLNRTHYCSYLSRQILFRCRMNRLNMDRILVPTIEIRRQSCVMRLCAEVRINQRFSIIMVMKHLRGISVVCFNHFIMTCDLIWIDISFLMSCFPFVYFYWRK